MKSYAGFVRDDRRELHRAELLEMLGQDAALFVAVESAENVFWHHATMAEDTCEADRAIHKELSGFLAAVEAMRSFYNPGGSAKAIFEAEAFPLLHGKPIQALRDLFDGVPGDALVMAAQRALDGHNVANGRPSDPDKAARNSLVGSIAAVAVRVGIEPVQHDRSGEPTPFERLLQYVFDRVCIEVKPASATRDLRTSRAK